MMSKLPDNVRPVKDRHGKTRYRFRRKGYPSAYLPGEPGTAKFHAALAQILEAGEVAKKPIRSLKPVTPKTFDHIVRLYQSTPKWRKKAANTCLLYTSPSPRDRQKSRMPSSA